MHIKEGFCFLTREEVNSFNRVNKCPGARWADKNDQDRVNHILDICADKGIVKFRTDDGGFKIWQME
jgi:hypothetical protein